MVDEDGPDERRRDPRPSQRIRIVGAESASGEDAPAEPPRPSETSGPSDDPNKFGAIPKISPDGPPPPGVDDTDQAATQAVPIASADEPPAGGDELPHWTDPPSGQVPAVSADDEEELDVWAGLSTGPQWKGQGEEDGQADDFSDLHDMEAADAAAAEAGVPEAGAPEASGPEAQPPESDAVPVVAIDDLSDPVPPDAVESAAGPPQRPAESQPPPGDPYPPRIDEPAVAAAVPDNGGRDMNTAIAVGVGLVVVAGICFYLGSAATVILVTLILGFAAVEFFSATQRAGYHAVPIIGMVATASLPLAAYYRGDAAIPLVLVLTVGTLIAWWLLDLSPERAVPNIGITLLGVVYIGVFGSFAALLLRAPNGIGLVVAAVVVTVAHDVGGLFLGQRFGATQFSAASPNKTLEGFFGGVVAATVASFVILGMVGWHPWEPGSAIAVGVAGGLAAAFGDLCESRLKRDLGVKDMGEILPGHGGVLDRFDGMLFVLPATYYVALVLEVGA